MAVFVLSLNFATTHLRAEEDSAYVVAFEHPSIAVIHSISESRDLNVIWCEAGLIIAETARPKHLPRRWGGRVLVRVPGHQEVAFLRHQELEHLRAEATRHQGTLRSLSTKRVAEAQATAGPVWVLLGAKEEWPRAAMGCHGGLILGRRTVNPLVLIDSGPPGELEAWVLHNRPLVQQELDLVNEVSIDSIQAYFNALVLNGVGLAGDRWVFGVDLEALHLPRVVSIMERNLSGISGTEVVEQVFDMQRDRWSSDPPLVPPARHITDSTRNIIGRIPGSVPDTGTFVICAHVDATGSRNKAWRDTYESQGVQFPTPGAEDNATGVASLLEIMRCVANGVRSGALDFAFDLEFIAFSGEEAEGVHSGLVGSAHYVAEALSDSVKLLGAFNMDMVGSDSLGNVIKIVHNTASTWMASLVQQAAAQTVPPVDLTIQMELEERRSSDHNSFWAERIDAIEGADGSLDVLREYASYHRPGDTGFDVDLSKLTEVTRLMLAALLRFNTGASIEPKILAAPEKLQLTRTVVGTQIPYTTQRLWPGAPLQAHFSLYSVGSQYDGPLRTELFIANAAGRRSVFVDEKNISAPTGARLDFLLDPVPIGANDRGTNRLVAEVTTQGAAGTHVDTVEVTFIVEPKQRELQVEIVPNPVSSLSDALIRLDLSEEGTLQIDLFNLEGEKITTLLAGKVVKPFIQGSNQAPREIRLTESTTSIPNLSSGTYLMRARLKTVDETLESMSRLVVVR